jgi:ribosomal protein L30E
MKTIDNLPKSNGTIGIREIVKSINSGAVKKVIIAKNCPESVRGKIPGNVEVEMFSGNQKELGTKLGKPFPVSAVGYNKSVN